MAIATKALIFYNSDLLVLTRSAEEAAEYQNLSLLDFPGGRLEYGETPEEGLKREIKEETGLLINKLELFSVETVMAEEGLQLVVIYYFAKTDCNSIQLSKEHKAYQWINNSYSSSDFPVWMNEIIKKIKKF